MPSERCLKPHFSSSVDICRPECSVLRSLLRFVFNLMPVADSDDVCLVDRLFSSSLVAVVSLSSPRKLKVCHFKKGTEICNYSYSNTILNVKLNRLVCTTVLSYYYYSNNRVAIVVFIENCHRTLCLMDIGIHNVQTQLC